MGGKAQCDRYEASLQRAIDGLADYPEAGARREPLFPGCRIRPVEHHLLNYRILDDEIEVIRVLHERADHARHL